MILIAIQDVGCLLWGLRTGHTLQQMHVNVASECENAALIPTCTTSARAVPCYVRLGAPLLVARIVLAVLPF